MEAAAVKRMHTGDASKIKKQNDKGTTRRTEKKRKKIIMHCCCAKKWCTWKNEWMNECIK